MTLTEAIFKLNPIIITMRGEVAYDKDGNVIQYDLQDATNLMDVTNCKLNAQSLLKDTDWTEIPSVTNTANTPHLINSSDFISYRNSLRELAVNPISNPTWPPLPTEQWS
jgi:hypothetical protein